MKDYLEKLGISSFEDGYRLIRQGTALIDGSGFGILKVSGDSAAEELNALVTKDVQFLNIDTISECLVLEEDASRKPQQKFPPRFQAAKSKIFPAARIWSALKARLPTSL